MSLENPTFKVGRCAYTGIGSRQTPDSILALMEEMGYCLAKKGLILRSGGADGADHAFEKGVRQANGAAEIFIPWATYSKEKDHHDKYIMPFTDQDITDQAFRRIMTLIPYWDNLRRPIKLLHGRNVFQILGRRLNDPSDFVICYAKPTGKKKKPKGGTGVTVALGEQCGVEIINLAMPKDLKRFKKALNQFKEELSEVAW